MTGMVQGQMYVLTVRTMTATTGTNGSGDYYAGTYMDQFEYSIEGQARQTLQILTQEVWGINRFIFIAPNNGDVEITFYPKTDGAYTNGGNSVNLEAVNLSVDSVNALVILDTDGDGVFDNTDIDDDNDGILDQTEYGTLDFDGDEDGDGVPNYLDVNDDNGGGSGSTDYTDNNGDGIPDAYDFDGDGIPNHIDLDSDNDGILDNVEAQVSGGSFIAFTSTDTDMDGLVDVYDTTPNGNVDGSGSIGITPIDTDTGTGFDDNPDYLDIDSDQDGIPDNIEAQTTLGYVAPTGNVGTNGVDSAYENVDTYSPVALTPVNTDNSDNQDYRDLDSDNDLTSDLDESGLGNVISNSDDDGDGLNNNHDNTDTNNVSNFDATNGITTPSSAFTDTDTDVNSGGDVDYRDNVTGLDTDGDGIPDSIDIDDDDDGIPDDQECVNAPVAAGGANAITVDVGVNQEAQILDGLTGGGNGARMNNTSDVLVLQLRAGDAIVPTGTVITITTTASNTADKQLRFQQSDEFGNNTSNNWDVTYNMTPAGDQDFTGSGNGNVHIITYTLASDATHIKVTMLTRSGGRINMDYLEYAAFNVCTSGDTDGDGIVDSLDIDSDNDGILDNIEAQSTAGYVAKSGVDNNNDGLDDAYNNFLGSGFNGIQTSQLINTDGSLTNADTIPDYLDIDSDNDGIPDNIEAQITLTYIAPNGVTKGNGMDSAYSFNDSFANTGLSSSLVNTDGDAEPDYRDTDADGDGTNDDAEGLTGTPTFTGTDTDGDGLDDAFEHGSNNDGFIVNDGISDPKTSGIIDVDADVNSGGNLDYRDTLVGSDTDGDGIVDSVDIDDDNDGILDTVEGGGDFDGDGIINSLDLDSDGDGILDIIESQASTGAIVLSGNDADNDGLDDNFDATPNGNSDGTGSIGTSPIVTTATDTTPDYLDIDTDDDGIPDNVEAQSTLGYTAPTGNVGLNGVDSAYENNDTFNPTGVTIINSDSAHATNSDTIPDYRDTDSDGDTTLDSAESGITPNAGSLGTDSDGDGLDDIYEGSNSSVGEAYDVNDEINDPVNDLLDADGDGGSTGDVDYRDTASQPDTDSDGITDDIDIDDDNDGILDINEDANGDTDNDPLTNPTDTDSDGIPNHLDIDADNDGIPDNVEAQLTIGYVAPSGSGTGITDDDGDGLDDNYDANTGDMSTGASLGLTPVNTDNITGNNTDANPDYIDTDADGDGTLDINENGNASTLLSTDTDGDGYDDAFEGVLNDNDVNDNINNPSTDLPDIDSDVNTASTNPPATNYNDVDYRDIDDDRVTPSIAGNILWLRADIAATTTSWTDQSGSANNAVNGATQPTINTSGVNFNPSYEFNGSTQSMQIVSGIFDDLVSYDDITAYIVSKSDVVQNSYGFLESFDGGEEFIINVPWGDNQVYFGIEGGSSDIDFAWGSSVNTFNIFNFFGSGTPANTPLGNVNQALFRDGSLLGTDNNFDTSVIGNSSNNFTIGSGSGSNFFDGDIAEIIVFSEVQSDARQQQIQSYLALKYGITLDQTDIAATSVDEGDYVLEDLTTTVWDHSANSAYHNDVAGIGRDDGMLLTQKQSKSVNDDATVTIGLGNIATNNANNSSSINTNKSFLVWGNNGAGLTSSSSKTLICAPEVQLDRVWKIVETGSIGTVQVAMTEATVGSFNINSVLNTANTIKVLKIADDATFTTNVKHLPLTSVDINGTNHLVANFDFDGTKYFTYSEINGIFWNGDSAAWNGGAGTAGAPSTIAADIDKVLVIDAETTLNNTSVINDANVECVWVKPNTKLVINDGHYLEFDEDFLLEGEIRLIGDAQIIQTHTGLSNVQGNGKVYRDQKAGVPNEYRYHYWTSPVVAALGNTTFTVDDVMKDGTTPTSENSAIKDINFVSWNGNVSSLNGAPTDPITIASYWIFSYFNGATRDDWVQKGHTNSINVAEGFIMKSTGRVPQNYTFVGTPNDGTYSKTVSAGTSSLVGNPYPSVLDTQKFIQDNSSVIDGTLYFWEHTGESTTTDIQVEGHGKYGYIGGYSQRNEAMGVAANSVTDETAGLGDATYTAPPQYIAVGQGFFVSAPSNKGGTFSFENSQRTYSANNHFFKGQRTQIAIPNFKLGFDYTNATNAKVHRQLGINFKEGNTFSYESGFDSHTFDLQSTDIYWNFPEIESNLIIAGVGSLDAQLQIPIGVVIDTDKPVKIIIDDKENMDGYTIYLVDLLTGQIFNLETPKELNLPKGTYTDRFALIFGGSALGVDEQEILNKILVYSDSSNNDIVIKNNNSQTIKKVALYNLLGQKVKEWKNFDQSFETRLSTSELSSAVYLIKLSTDSGNISKKIILK